VPSCANLLRPQAFNDEFFHAERLTGLPDIGASWSRHSRSKSFDASCVCEYFDRYLTNPTTQSIVAFQTTINDWQAEGLEVGYTTGVFDLFNQGPRHFLQKCRDECDRLVVGVDADELVTRSKGPARPIRSATARVVDVQSSDFEVHRRLNAPFDAARVDGNLEGLRLRGRECGRWSERTLGYQDGRDNRGLGHRQRQQISAGRGVDRERGSGDDKRYQQAANSNLPGARQRVFLTRSGKSGRYLPRSLSGKSRRTFCVQPVAPGG
jgi:hypothetical protein